VFGQFGAPEVVATADHHCYFGTGVNNFHYLPSYRSHYIGINAKTAVTGKSFTRKFQQHPTKAFGRDAWPQLTGLGR
jgi:hypothetical protein